jgi:N-acetyl-anhydromuramyl-L-alanine amidase AmpD
MIDGVSGATLKQKNPKLRQRAREIGHHVRHVTRCPTTMTSVDNKPTFSASSKSPVSSHELVVNKNLPVSAIPLLLCAVTEFLSALQLL